MQTIDSPLVVVCIQERQGRTKAGPGGTKLRGWEEPQNTWEISPQRMHVVLCPPILMNILPFFQAVPELDDDLCFKIWEANFTYNEFVYYEIRHKH